ncbi:MAG: hypothetical protein ABJG99_11765 [Crocinitomicaceae bacterium]
MKFIIVKPKINQKEFLKIIIDQFPEIKEEILDDDYDGLIHLQISVFARYTNNYIKIKRFDEVKRIFDFFEKVIDKVDPDTENALYVSFLEHIEFENMSENEIKSFLKPIYFDSWKQLRNY